MLILTNFGRKLTKEEEKFEFKYGDKYLLPISVCFRQILRKFKAKTTHTKICVLLN